MPQRTDRGLAASAELDSGRRLCRRSGAPAALGQGASDAPSCTSPTTPARLSRDTVELGSRPMPAATACAARPSSPTARWYCRFPMRRDTDASSSLRSADGGMTWSAPIAAAEDPSCEFEEPAPLVLPSGRLLMHSARTGAAPSSASTPTMAAAHGRRRSQTGIDGYPAHLLRLADGRLLCTYGYRKPPYAIRAVLSEDDGATWQTGPGDHHPRKPAEQENLGYPCTVAIGPELLTIYYGEDRDGVTGVWASSWNLPRSA